MGKLHVAAGHQVAVLECPGVEKALLVALKVRCALRPRARGLNRLGRLVVLDAPPNRVDKVRLGGNQHSTNLQAGRPNLDLHRTGRRELWERFGRASDVVRRNPHNFALVRVLTGSNDRSVTTVVLQDKMQRGAPRKRGVRGLLQSAGSFEPPPAGAKAVGVLGRRTEPRGACHSAATKQSGARFTGKTD